MINSRCLRGFSLSMLSYVFVILVIVSSCGMNSVFVSSSRQLLAATESDPLNVNMLYVPMSTFVLTERQTCYYTDEKVKEYVKAMEIYSPDNIGKSILKSMNFYFVKLEHHAGETFLLDFNKRGPQRVKSKIINTNKILDNNQHFELYRGHAPIEQDYSTIFCPTVVSKLLVVRCVVTMRDTFGDKTIILMRSVQNSLSAAFNIREINQNENIPYSMEPNINKFGEAFVSFVPPPRLQSSIVKIAFAGTYIPSSLNDGEGNVTGSDKYRFQINRPANVNSKQSILDIDIRFTGLDVTILDSQIVRRHLLTSGIAKGLGLSDGIHIVPTDVYSCPSSERCNLADSRPTHDARTDQNIRNRRQRRRLLRYNNENSNYNKYRRNLRYKDPRDPSLPPSTAVRMMVYGEYYSVRMLLDRLEENDYQQNYIINNITELLSSVYGKVSGNKLENVKISSIHPIRLDGEYVFILPYSSVADGDTTQLILSLLLVVGVCLFSSVAIYIIQKCEKAAIARRKRIAKRKWALAHPEWRKKYDFAKEHALWKPPHPPPKPKPGEPISAEIRLAQIRHLRAMRAYERANKMMKNYEEAARKIQGNWRMKLARNVMKVLHQRRAELKAAIFIQRIWRGKVGRMGWVKFRNEVRALNAAALLVQRVWYKKNGMFSTFVLMRSLGLKDKQEQDRAIRDYFRKRAAACNLLARHVKRWLKKRNKACTVIQRHIRGHQCRKQVVEYKKSANKAASLLQKIWRGRAGRKAWTKNLAEIHKKQQAAIRIQFLWYKRDDQFSTFVLMRCLSVCGDKAEINYIRDTFRIRKKAMRTLERAIRRYIFFKRLNSLVARLRTEMAEQVPPPPANIKRRAKRLVNVQRATRMKRRMIPTKRSKPSPTVSEISERKTDINKEDMQLKIGQDRPLPKSRPLPRGRTARPPPVHTPRPAPVHTARPPPIHTARPTARPLPIHTARPTARPLPIHTASPTARPPPVHTARPLPIHTARPTARPPPIHKPSVTTNAVARAPPPKPAFATTIAIARGRPPPRVMRGRGVPRGLPRGARGKPPRPSFGRPRGFPLRPSFARAPPPRPVEGGRPPPQSLPRSMPPTPSFARPPPVHVAEKTEEEKEEKAPPPPPKRLTPRGLPRGSTPRGLPRGSTPRGLPRGSTPRGLPRGSTPRGLPRGSTPRGLPRGIPPKGRPSRGLPRGASPRGPPPGRPRPRSSMPSRGVPPRGRPNPKIKKLETSLAEAEARVKAIQDKEAAQAQEIERMAKEKKEVEALLEREKKESEERMAWKERIMQREQKKLQKNIAKQAAKAERARLKLEKEMKELADREEMAKIKALEAEENLIAKELQIKEMEEEMKRQSSSEAKMTTFKGIGVTKKEEEVEEISSVDNETSKEQIKMVIPQKMDESITIVNEEESNESSSVVSMEEIPITKDDLKTSSDEEEEELEQDAHVNGIDKSISTKDAEHLELKLQHQKNMLDRDRAVMKRKTEQVKQQLEAKINIQEHKHKKKQAKLMAEIARLKAQKGKKSPKPKNLNEEEFKLLEEERKRREELLQKEAERKLRQAQEEYKVLLDKMKEDEKEQMDQLLAKMKADSEAMQQNEEQKKKEYEAKLQKMKEDAEKMKAEADRMRQLEKEEHAKIVAKMKADEQLEREKLLGKIKKDMDEQNLSGISEKQVDSIAQKLGTAIEVLKEKPDDVEAESDTLEAIDELNAMRRLHEIEKQRNAKLNEEREKKAKMLQEQQLKMQKEMQLLKEQKKRIFESQRKMQEEFERKLKEEKEEKEEALRLKMELEEKKKEQEAKKMARVQEKALQMEMDMNALKEEMEQKMMEGQRELQAKMEAKIQAEKEKAMELKAKRIKQLLVNAKSSAQQKQQKEEEEVLAKKQSDDMQKLKEEMERKLLENEKKLKREMEQKLLAERKLKEEKAEAERLLKKEMENKLKMEKEKADAVLKEKERLMKEQMEKAQKEIEALNRRQAQIEKEEQDQQEAQKEAAIKANTLAMEKQMQSLKDDMEKQMLAKMKQSEELYNMKLKEMEAGQRKLHEEMEAKEAKIQAKEKKRAIADRMQISLQVGRLQRAEEKKKGKRISLKEQLLNAKKEREENLEKEKLEKELKRKRKALQREKEKLAKKKADEKRSKDQLNEEKECNMMRNEELRTRAYLIEQIGKEREPIERANMEKEEADMRKYLKFLLQKQQRAERHQRAREARMRKIKAKESKIRRLRMPRAPTEKMHNRATRLAKWYKHTRDKNRLRSWFAIRRMSATTIASIYRGYKGREIAKKLIADREIRRERERRIKEFEEQERIREEKEAAEAEERRKRLDARHKERKLRRKIREEIRKKEQKKARKYVVKHMRKQIASRFERDGMERDDDVETKSSGQDVSTNSSSNTSSIDTSDESELNSSLDSVEKKIHTPKSHQKAKKNKMGKTSNKSRPSKYTIAEDVEKANKQNKKKKNKKKVDDLKQKYKVKSTKGDKPTFIAPMVSTVATMDVIDSVNRMNDAASRMINSKNLGTAKTILIGAERMTQNMVPGALNEEFNEARSVTLMRLGLVMNHEKDYEGGLVYLQEALKLDRTPAIMNNICSTLSALGKHHEALNWALDAVDAAQYDTVLEALPVALHNLGIEYEALGEIDSAFTAFNRAKRLANERFGIDSGLSRSIHHSLVIARRFMARESQTAGHGGPLFSMPRPRGQPTRRGIGRVNINAMSGRKKNYEEDIEARINDY